MEKKKAPHQARVSLTQGIRIGRPLGSDKTGGGQIIRRGASQVVEGFLRYTTKASHGMSSTGTRRERLCHWIVILTPHSEHHTGRHAPRAGGPILTHSSASKHVGRQSWVEGQAGLVSTPFTHLGQALRRGGCVARASSDGPTGFEPVARGTGRRAERAGGGAICVRTGQMACAGWVVLS